MALGLDKYAHRCQLLKSNVSKLIASRFPLLA